MKQTEISEVINALMGRLSIDEQQVLRKDLMSISIRGLDILRKVMR